MTLLLDHDERTDAPLGATLLFDHAPKPLDLPAVAQQVRGLGDVAPRRDLLVLESFSREHDAPAPVAYIAERPGPAPKPLLEDLAASQLWRLGDVRDDVLESSRYQVPVGEFLGRLLPPDPRLRALGEVVLALVRSQPGVIAVHITATDEIFLTRQLLELATTDDHWWHELAFNVRRFDDGVDTYGLYAFALPDIEVPRGGEKTLDAQLRFVNDTGRRILGEGDLDDGTLFEGIAGPLTGTHDWSAVDPHRTVLRLTA